MSGILRSIRVAPRWLLALSLAGGLGLATAVSSTASAKDWQQERELFEAVDKDLKRGQRFSYITARDKLRTYPLYPYLVYRDFKKRIAKVSDKEILQFLDIYRDSVISHHLRQVWLLDRAKRGQRDVLVTHYVLSDYAKDKALVCYYAEALLQTGRAQEARALTMDLWLVSHSQDDACDPLFAEAKQRQWIDDRAIWQRVLLVMATKQTRFSNYLARSLSSSYQQAYQQLKLAYSNPVRVLSKVKNRWHDWGDSEIYQDVILHAFSRLQRKDPSAALRWWKNLHEVFIKSPQFYNLLQRSIGVRAAKQLRSQQAYDQLIKVDAHTEESHFWLIRSALRLQDWPSVLRHINTLERRQQDYPQWQYWRARALEKTGEPARAQGIWQRLAERSGYHSYMAADRVGAAYHLGKTSDLLPASLRELEDSLPVQRIRQLTLLNREFPARREMLYLINEMDSDERLKLAMVINSWGWSGGVILAMRSRDFEGDLDLRFPVAFQTQVARESKRYRLPQHWLYGLMRRESAFVPQIKSHAGALGLMQVMPQTAREVARRLRLRWPSTARILEPAFNVRLGSAYLRQVHDMNQRRLPLSLASYNAGPTAVKRWLKATPVDDMSIWIDTIPNDETRPYVRAVLFYATVYQHKLYGRVDRLNKLLAKES